MKRDTPAGLTRLGLTLLVACAAARALPAAELATRPAGPQPPEHARALKAHVARCDTELRVHPQNGEALQGRAESLFRLGWVGESVRDFDQVVVLAPDVLPHNWQRGLALYYAGRFADAAEQFRRCREVNPQDVENAAYHFASLARAPGPAEAARQLIPVDRDARVPMARVHAMYAGKATPDDVIAEARKGDPGPDELRERMFNGHLYVGLWHEAHGRPAEAARHVRLAAKQHGIDGYMGDVARVHAWLAETNRLPPAGPASRPATRPATR